MKNYKRRIIFGCLVFVFASLADAVFACSCQPLPSVYKSFESADAVFVGKVIGSNETGDENRFDEEDIIFDFEVTEKFKGIKGQTVELNLGRKDSSCYGGYPIGGTYLIYAYDEGYKPLFKNSGKTEGVFYQSSFCNRSENIESAQDQIYLIREMLKGKPEPQIYGSVALDKYKNGGTEFLQGIRIVAEGGKKRFQTVTDKNGIFRFDDLPKGIYKIKSVPSEKHTAGFPTEETFAVFAKRQICLDKPFEYEGVLVGCLNDVENAAYYEFNLFWNTEVKGKIVDAEGKSVEKAAIRLLPIERANEEFVENYWDNLRKENGEYSINGTPPGKYVLAVEIENTLNSKSRQRIFYPEVAGSDKARVFDITAPMKLNIDFKLPKGKIARKLIGEILTESGGSVGGFVSVSLDSQENAESGENSQFNIMSLNNRGQFEFDVFENSEYWLHVWLNNTEKVNGETKEIKRLVKTEKIKIGKESEVRKIIVSLPEK